MSETTVDSMKRQDAPPDAERATDSDALHEYYPGVRRGWGFRAWREIFAEAISSRELTWRLFLRDFSARYRQSVLGVLWAVILPLIAVGTFVLLNRSGLFIVGDTGVSYPVFALLGLTVWQIFAGGLVACSNAIVGGGSMVIKINFPKSTLVMAAMGQVLFELLVRLLLTAVVMVMLKVAPHAGAVYFPLAVLPMLLLTLGLGLFLSLINVVLRDIAHIATFITSFLLLLTPVLYAPRDAGLLASLTRFNPVAGLVIGPRDLVLTGHLTDPLSFAWNSAVAVLFFLFSWRLFHLVEPRMAERV